MLFSTFFSMVQSIELAGVWLSVAVHIYDDVFLEDRSLTVAARMRAARVSKRFWIRERTSETEYLANRKDSPGGLPYARLRLPERSIQWRNMAAYPRASGSVRSCSTVKRIFLPQ